MGFLEDGLVDPISLHEMSDIWAFLRCIEGRMAGDWMMLTGVTHSLLYLYCLPLTYLSLYLAYLLHNLKSMHLTKSSASMDSYRIQKVQIRSLSA